MANVLIDENTMKAIGDSIRGKNGEETLYLPSEMPAAIDAITTSGGIEDGEKIILSGDCGYALRAPCWKKYDGKIEMKDVTSAEYLFYQTSGDVFSDLTIPFKQSSNFNAQYMFSNNNRTKFPKLIIPENFQIYYGSSMFRGCSKVTEFPDDYIPAGTQFVRSDYLISYCDELTKMPNWIYTIDYSKCSSSSYSPYVYFGTYDYSLAEVVIPIAPVTFTSNCFSQTLNGTYLLKKVTFAPYDGVLNWSKQTININSNIAWGYGRSTASANLSWYNRNKRVTDDATYEALKDDPYYWTTDAKYSKFNHDSLVEFINSLPTVSGTQNVLNVLGTQGSGTDGGGFNELTDEEIAVAVEKGWTITIV